MKRGTQSGEQTYRQTFTQMKEPLRRQSGKDSNRQTRRAQKMLPHFVPIIREISFMRLWRVVKLSPELLIALHVTRQVLERLQFGPYPEHFNPAFLRQPFRVGVWL